MKHKWSYDIWLAPVIALVGTIIIMGLALLMVAIEYHALTGDWF